MKALQKRTFWKVTRSNLKSNLECAFCKQKEECPLKYRAETREKYACKEEMRKREKIVFKV